MFVVPRRCGAEPWRAVRRGAAADPAGVACAFTRPQYDALRRETSVFSDVFAEMPDIDSRIDGRMMAGTLVTGNFFSGAGRQRGARAHADARRRRSLRPPPGDGAQSPGLVPTLRERPGRVGRSLLVNGFSYRHRGRHAGGLSRTQRRCRPTIGRRSRSSVSSAGSMQEGRRRRHRHRRPAEARAVAANRLWRGSWCGIRDEPTEGRWRPPYRKHHARTEAGNHPARSRRSLLVFTPLFFAFGLDPDDWLRERRQPAAGARRLAPARDRHPAVAWRLAPPHHPATAHGEPAARAGRPRRSASPSREWSLEATIYAVTSTMAPEIAENVRLSAPAADWRVLHVPRGWRDRLHGVFRPRAGVAGHTPRAGADDARRGDERFAPGPRA